MPDPATDGTVSQSEALARLSRIAPEFVAAYDRWAGIVLDRGPLDDKTKSLILLALNIAVTNQNPREARRLVREAVDFGATTAELIEVAELTTMLGISTMTMAGPILLDEFAAAGISLPRDLDEARETIKKDFVADRGTWPAPLEAALLVVPDFVDAYRELSAIAVRGTALTPKVRELIVIAMDAATTHLHEIGTRAHVRAAIREGATVEEIVHALQLACLLGGAGPALGVTVILDVVDDV